MLEKEQIKVTLLANAGIMVEYKQTKILIDGIHENTKGVFPGLSQEELTVLINGEEPLYQDIDYLFFTHCHPDHFTASYVKEFLEKNRLKGILLPDQPTAKFKKLRQLAQEKSDQVWFLDLPLAEKEKITLNEDISVKVFRTIHAGSQFSEVQHYCFLLTIGSKQIVTLADSNYDIDYFSRLLAEEDITAAFINPLHLNQSRGRKIVNEVLQPERLVIYHIPFTEDSRFKIRKMVKRDMEKYGADLPPTDLLEEKRQEIYI